MVGHIPLKDVIGVRIPAPQHFDFHFVKVWVVRSQASNIFTVEKCRRWESEDNEYDFQNVGFMIKEVGVRRPTSHIQSNKIRDNALIQCLICLTSTSLSAGICVKMTPSRGRGSPRGAAKPRYTAKSNVL